MVFGDDDHCYRFARDAVQGLLAWDVTPKDLVQKLGIGVNRLRTFAREPHQVARRGCVVGGVGAWPDADFALVRHTEAAMASGQRFGFVSAVLDIGSVPLLAICVYPAEDEPASVACLELIDGAEVEENPQAAARPAER